MKQLTVCKTPLDGVLLIDSPTHFVDFRGEYVETYNRDLYHAGGIKTDFLQDDISISTYKCLRGLHGDQDTTKLISCLYGKFYLVVINNDLESPQYRQWTSFTLDDKKRQSVLIPPKFGNGYLVMSDWAIFHYKQNSYYSRAGQFTLIWNDPSLGLWWPIKDPIVSRRDEGLD